MKPLRDEAMPIRDFPFGVTPPSPPKATDTSCQLQPAHAPPPVDHARKTRAIESSCCSIRDKWTSFGDVQVSDVPFFSVLNAYDCDLNTFFAVPYNSRTLHCYILRLSLLWCSLSDGGGASSA